MINATEAVVDYLHESRGLDRVEAIQEIHEVESEIEHQETTWECSADWIYWNLPE